MYTEVVNTSDKLPKDLDGDGHSHHVLIDLDGDREWFCVGFYDYLDKKWIACYTTEIDINPETMRWYYLPLSQMDGMKIE